MTNKIRRNIHSEPTRLVRSANRENHIMHLFLQTKRSLFFFPLSSRVTGISSSLVTGFDAFTRVLNFLPVQEYKSVHDRGTYIRLRTTKQRSRRRKWYFRMIKWERLKLSPARKPSNRSSYKFFFSSIIYTLFFFVLSSHAHANTEALGVHPRPVSSLRGWNLLALESKGAIWKMKSKALALTAKISHASHARRLELTICLSLLVAIVTARRPKLIPSLCLSQQSRWPI